MSNDSELSNVSDKFAFALAMLDAMTDEEVIEFSKNLNLHLAMRFHDTR